MGLEKPVHLIGSPFQTIQAKIGLFFPPKLIWREDSSRSTRGSKIAKLKLAWSSKMFACTRPNFLKHPGGQSFPTSKHSDSKS